MRRRPFLLGEWRVDPRSCSLRHQDAAADIQLEPRAMDVLVTLCECGSLLSADDLLRLCWDGINVGENQVHKAIAQLRRALRDSATQPRYIENIRKRGYRIVAAVTPLPEGDAGEADEKWLVEAPFVGLDPFGPGHATVFFGREAATAQLLKAVSARAAGPQALLIVLGPSGSGKTSLVQAGLLPALARGAAALDISASAVLDLGDADNLPWPLLLGGALMDLERAGEPLFAGHSADSLGNILADGGPIPADGAGRAARFVLFIDRLEALFAPPAPQETQRRPFLAALDRLSRSGRAIIIAACRNDFYPDLAREPVLMEGKTQGGHVDLAPPSRAEIAQMIRLPAQAAGLRFAWDPKSERSLDDILCERAAGSPDALPLLQYTLQQLYLHRSPARELTMAAYAALGGIEGAIGKRAEAILQAQPPAVRAALPLLFSRVVAAGSVDGAVRGLRSPWTQLSSPEERRLAAALVEERLFVSDISDREPVFGVAHEALLRQWPRAVAWIEEHRQALAARARLETQARQWLAEGCRADRLLRAGRPLGEARDLLDHAMVPLNADIQALIRASVRQARRAERLRLGALAGVTLIALAAIFLGFRAREAEKVAALRLAEAEDLMDYMLGDFAEKLRPLGRLDLLDGVAQKAMGYLTAADAGRVPRTLRAQQAKALLTLAEVERARGHADPALRALTQADALLRASLADGGDDRALLKNLGAIAFWFGQIALDQGRLDAAGRHFGEYRDFAGRFSALDPADPDGWIEQSYALSNVGMLQLRRGEVDEAAQNFDASVLLKRRAVARRPDDRSLAAELADSLSWQAHAEAQRGHLTEAWHLYEQQRQVLLELRRQEADIPLWTYRIALADRLRGALSVALGRPDEALAILDDAVAGLEAILRQEPDNRRWQGSRFDILLLSARTALASSRLDVAKANLARISRSIDQAFAMNPMDDNMRRHQVQAFLLRAAILLRDGRADLADAEAAKAESLFRANEAPEITDKLKAIILANILLLRSEISQRQGADAAALRVCRGAIDGLRAFASASVDFRILDPWVRAHGCAGDREPAAMAIAALQRMGYRDPDYVQFTTSWKEKRP